MGNKKKILSLWVGQKRLNRLGRSLATDHILMQPQALSKTMVTKAINTLSNRAGYRYPVFIENRLLTFDRYTEPNVCVSNKISIHSLRRVKQVCVE